MNLMRKEDFHELESEELELRKNKIMDTVARKENRMLTNKLFELLGVIESRKYLRTTSHLGLKLA